MLKAALNGDRERGSHPALPFGAAELAADAAACVRAGAAAIHIHPRDDEGWETLAADVVDHTVRAVRLAAGVAVGVSTGAWIEPDPRRRAAPAPRRPHRRRHEAACRTAGAQRPDNGAMRGEMTRVKLLVASAVSAVAFGAAAWLLFGPRWTITGVLVGPLIVILAVAVVHMYATPDLNNDQPDEAAALLRGEMASWRTLARIWPSQFRNALASRLIVQSDALQAMNRDEEALRTANEAVAIYQDLAAERPGKYSPDLADALDHQSRLLAADDRQAEALTTMRVAVRLYRNLASADPARYLPALAECLTCEAGWLADIELSGEALAAVHEATDICQDKLPWQRLPSCAARAMLLEGELLCGQARYRDAARLLAKGWRLAAAADQQDLLRDAAPAIKTAYRADPDHFATVWQAETGAEPPDWLST